MSEEIWQPEHKELTKKEHTALVDAAFKLEQRIKGNVQQSNTLMWELAKDVYEFHEAGAWGLLEYETLNEFLAQPDIDLSRNQFFRLSRVYRDLVVVKQLPAKKLQTITPARADEVRQAIMRAEVEADQALGDAETLGSRDLRKKYRGGTSGKPDSPGGSLKADDEPVRVQCDACGSWYVPDSEDEPDG